MEDDNGLYNIYIYILWRDTKQIMIGMLIDGISFEVALGTGVSISVIGKETHQKLQNRGLKKKLAPTNAGLKDIHRRINHI